MKSKNYLIGLFLLTNFISLFGQDYSAYYQLCTEASEQIYLKNYPAALEKFELAFKDVPYVHTARYVEASKSAILAKKYDKAYTYICQLKKQGWSNDFLNKRMFRKFKKSDYYQKYKENISSYEAIFNASINKDYVRLIDSLHYIDQYILRDNKEYKGKYTIDPSKLTKDRKEMNQVNIDALLELINEHGFPSEQRVGREAYDQATIILLHNLRLKKNIKHYPILLKAIKTGEFSPNHYAAIYEQYVLFEKGISFYTTLDMDLSEKKLAEIDANRKEIGLKPLKAFYIKNKGRTMKSKWGVFKK